MRDFPSCFGENGVQVADASCSNVGTNKSPNNSVTCIYRCKLFDRMTLITLTWSKNLMGQTLLSLEIDHPSASHFCKVDVKPSLFSRRKGSKSLELNLGKIEVFWDLSMAVFGPGHGPEPLEGYYIGVVCKGVMVLLIGDLTKEAFRKSGAIASFSSGTLISKREHIFGKRVLCTKARFCDNGRIHDLKIEHDGSSADDPNPALVVRIDSKTVMQVRHLRWKFRGNETILVDGLPVEVSWDVHDWLFSPSLGSAIFMFRASLSNEKMRMNPPLCDSSPGFSWSCSQSYDESKPLGLGFSLFLYAWKNE